MSLLVGMKSPHRWKTPHQSTQGTKVFPKQHLLLLQCLGRISGGNYDSAFISVYSFIFFPFQSSVRFSSMETIHLAGHMSTLSIPTMSSGGLLLRYTTNGGYSDTTPPCQVLKLIMAMNVGKTKCQMQLCPSQPGTFLCYFVLLSSFYTKLEKEKQSNSNKTGKYSGQLQGVSLTHGSRHSCSCPSCKHPS